MDLKLTGKRALVTGSSSGIGAAIAKRLAAEGAIVAIQGRRPAAAEATADSIRASGGTAYVVLGDLSRDADAAEVAKQAQEKLGGVDILVNNAGAYPLTGWWDSTPDQWLELYNQNVVSMLRMIQHLVPPMKDAKWGRVVNIASGVGTSVPAMMTNYSITKAANIAMTVSLAKELADTGITVNTVSPGPVITEGFDEMALQIAQYQGWDTSDINAVRARLEQGMMKTPVGRLGTADDIADLVAFLVSPLAGNIHGSNFRSDGGYVPSIN